MQIRKPMLAGRPVAGKGQDVTDVFRYPVIASPKLDGIRCVIVNGHAMSRNLKPIPNDYIRTWLEANVPDGFDGELMVDGEEFSGVASGVMRGDGQPDFYYAVFDYLTDDQDEPFVDRWRRLRAVVEAHPEWKERIWIVPQVTIDTAHALRDFEERCLAKQYEGVMIRDPAGGYLFGRSSDSPDTGTLLKLKRFQDSEAEIIGFTELRHNENAAFEDNLGHTKHSHEKAGMVPGGTLGNFQVRDIKTGIEFEVGTGKGLTQKLRAEVWARRGAYLGKLIKYKYQACGVKEKPRFPVFLCFRSKNDMD